MADLFTPITLGDISCKNRIFMAPLTRAHADDKGVPTEIMAEYYAQRADAGLIISEAIAVSRQAMGWIYAPGLWNGAQTEGWKPVTRAVHDAGGKIVAQIWHMGRLAHSDNTGEQPVAPSALAWKEGHIHTYRHGKQPYETPRALTAPEIRAITADFALAAKNALKAGFDGVQIHGANGYLIDEFLRDGTNHRRDEYGGTPQNRIRFLREVTEAVVKAIGAEKVGVRLSPNGEIQGTFDSAPEKVFLPAAQALQETGIAWLELREGGPDDTFQFASPTSQPKLSPEIRKIFKGRLVLNGDYTFKTATRAVEEAKADAIAFGRDFISNPDLVTRFKTGAPLNKDDINTWYGAWHGRKGYTDYPTLAMEKDAANR